MDISQVNYEPWKVVRELGHGSFGTVYEINREEFGETYKAALKVITIPQSASDIVANRADGMDDMSITAYYNSMVQELTHEFALLSKLKGHTNIVSYEDHKVVQHEDGIGWDIYIRMELLTSLTAIAASRNFTKKEVMKLGIDICSALILCEQKGIIHRDIKPDNIFISDNGDFELGDFGIARTATKTMSNMSRKGTPNYMAPEVYMNRPYNATADIYSLGIVLYQLMNYKRLPFMPAQVTVTNREEALGLRMSGRPLPLPEQADPRFAAVILKACAFRPEERYASAQFMKKDLEILLAEEERGASAGAAGAQSPASNVQFVQAQTGQYAGQYAQQSQNAQYTGQQQMSGQFTGQQPNQFAQSVQNQAMGNQTMGGGMPGSQNINNQSWANATQMQQQANLISNGSQPTQNQNIRNASAGAAGEAGQKQDKNKKIFFGLIGGVAVLFIVVIVLAVSVFRGGDAEGVTEVAAPTEPSVEENPAEEPEEAKEEPTEAADVPEEQAAATELSEDLGDYMFELEGNLYQLPISYADFKEAGWEMDPTRSGTEDDEIVAGGYDYYYLTNGISTINCEIFNASGNTKTAKECNIGALTVYAKDNLDFCIAKGIEPAASVEEVKAAFGTPSSSNTYDATETLKYETDPNNYQEYVRFSCDSVKAANNYIELKRFVATENDTTEVSSEVPAYLSSYVAPTSLGTDPKAPIFELDGDLYRLPCPLSEFTNNGWEISAKEMDALGGQNREGYCITLRKGEMTFSPELGNFEKTAQLLENCAVTGISMDDYTLKKVDNSFFVMPGGLTIAATIPEVEALGFSKEEYDSSVTYEYTEGEINIRYRLYTDDTGSVYIDVRNRNWDY